MEQNKPWEAVSIDKLLAELRTEEKQLISSLSNVQGKIKSLLETRALLTGQEFNPNKEKSIPDLLEDVLRQCGAKHVDELVEILRADYPQTGSVAKQTVSGALIRYSNQGRKFKRVGKNTFAVIDDKNGENYE